MLTYGFDRRTTPSDWQHERFCPRTLSSTLEDALSNSLSVCCSCILAQKWRTSWTGLAHAVWIFASSVHRQNGGTAHTIQRCNDGRHTCGSAARHAAGIHDSDDDVR